MHSILFIADGSLDRPILHSQGIPLLKRLSALGHACHVISFEESRAVLDSPLGLDLARQGVRWHPVVLRSSSSSLERVKMVLWGVWDAWRLCRAEKIEIVHARSYRPAVIASLLKLLLNTGFLFDMRGFLIDEQLMLGRWKPSGIRYAAARQFERWCLQNADGVISNTTRFTQRILEFPYLRPERDRQKIILIPNCVDTARFSHALPGREELRARLGWQDRVVLCFAGEVRRWERFDLVLEFYKACRQVDPRVYLAFFVYGQVEQLRKEIEAAGIEQGDFCLITVPSGEIARYLSASDAGIIIRADNLYIREISSPLKFGEYLSSGLPVVINPGIGDTERIIRERGVGVVIDSSSPVEFHTAAEKLMALLSNLAVIRQRCHDAAVEELSLELALRQYLLAYDRLAAIRARH